MEIYKVHNTKFIQVHNTQTFIFQYELLYFNIII